MASFSEKQISVQFSLASGQFEGGGNSFSVSGVKVDAQITVTGAPEIAQMALSIWGLPLTIMQQLTTVGTQWNARYKNGIDVLAGDDESGLSLVFSGTIFNAFVQGDQPNVSLQILAAPLVFESVQDVPPTSINGSADAAGMIQKLAGQMAGIKSFENNGVNVKLTSPYYYGSPWAQARQIAQDGNFDITVDRGVLVVSPPGTPRQGTAPLVSPQTGMVGYPTFVQNRVVVKALFNPAVKVFGPVQIKSSLIPANGTWQVMKEELDLQSIEAGGNWFMTLYCNPLGTQP